MSDADEPVAPTEGSDRPTVPERRLGGVAPTGIKVLWFAIGAVVLVLIVQVAFGLRGAGDDGRFQLREGELAVTEAIGRSPAAPVTVRGYVFLRKGFPPRLCSGAKDSDPRTCIGPFIDLFGLDESRLDLERGDEGGIPVAWTDTPVALLGTMNGSAMEVTEILS